MSRASFASQVLAVIFRRAPALRPDPGEPVTFPGRVRELWRRRATQDQDSTEEKR
jgi:hypothetical protein